MIKTSATEAISHIKSGMRIFIQGGVATPNVLINALVDRAKSQTSRGTENASSAQQDHKLERIEILHLHTVGEAEYAKPEFKDIFRICNLFVGANMRPYLNMQNVDYLPCFLSEIPSLFRSGKKKPDVALIHVSLPDHHGFCSLGTSVDTTRAALETASIVIAQVNPNMPRVHGDGLIHVDRIDFMVEVNQAIPEIFPKALTEVEIKIGKNTAEIIEDGATLQMGIGSIPDAVLASLGEHKDLGIHTEMWSDGALPLLEKGVINNSKKKIHPDKSVSAFVTGTKKLYDFIHDNPSVIQLDVSYVNNPSVIARNQKVTAINSAVEIDLTGQVCADSIGHHIISGVGGQIDFIRGASLSVGGKPIIALTSRTAKGVSRIVSTLKAGAGVVTTRAHVHYVVTEYGVADLFGKTIGERAKALIEIAHPEDRAKLQESWHNCL